MSVRNLPGILLGAMLAARAGIAADALVITAPEPCTNLSAILAADEEVFFGEIDTSVPKPKPEEKPPVIEEAPPPPMPEVPPPPKPVAKKPARGRFGLRVGVMIPSEGKETDSDAATFGGVYYGRKGSESRTGLELGLHVTGPFKIWVATDDNLEAEETIVLAHLIVTRDMGRVVHAYGGASLFFESWDSKTESPDGHFEGHENVGMTVDIGIGASFASNRFELRAGYSLLPGSENIPGFAQVALGATF